MAADSLFASPWILRGDLNLRAGDLGSAATDFAYAANLDSAAVAAHAGWGRSLLGQHLFKHRAFRY